MAFPWGSLISAGGSILGGLLGGGSKGPSFGDQKSWMREQMMSKIKWTVDDAKRSGIHPLVALGSQASGGFASPAMGDGMGGFGWGDAVGRGLEAIGDLYTQDQDQLEREAERKLEQSRYDDARFDKILEDQARIKSEQQAVKESDARIAEHMSNAALNAARMQAIGANAGVTELVGPKTPGTLSGPFLSLPTAPGASPASDWEDYGGEAGDLIGGGQNMLWSLLNAGSVDPNQVSLFGKWERDWNNWLWNKTGGRLGYQYPPPK